MHNDSGDVARVFLVDRSGATRAVVQLAGVRAVDWEDIALAPGASAGTFDVCVADIGDNEAQRARVMIYRFSEPELPQDARTLEVAPTVHAFRYAEGATNAEAFAVDPRTGDGYIFTKRLDGRSFVYRLSAPWPTEGVVELPCWFELALPAALPPARVVTGADFSPDGGRLALRCVWQGWEWRSEAEGESLDVPSLLARKPVLLPLAAELQGEALAYRADGAALLTLGEGVHRALFELRRRAATDAGD